MTKQPMLIVGSGDDDGNLWTSILVGEAGFMHAEPQLIEIDLSRSHQVDSDPLWNNLERAPRVGLLVIDLRSRARLRINGRVSFTATKGLRINVEQAYPNCPQYIQRRNFRPSIETESSSESTTEMGSELTADQQRWIHRADTFFVSSQHVSHGVDASHRGGNPGFIQLLSPNRLRVPDYSGNGMFNTLGNFQANPRAGILIPDFENGHVLQLTGRPEILWDEDDKKNETGGTRRYWEFTIEKWIQTRNAISGSTEFLDYSPDNPSISA